MAATAQAPTEMVLRCYVYKRGPRYQGECVDLDVIVERDTLHETVEALRDAIDGYVATVNEQGWAEQLIPRRSPLPRRLAYQLRRLRWQVKRSLADLELDRVVTFDNGHVSVA